MPRSAADGAGALSASEGSLVSLSAAAAVGDADAVAEHAEGALQHGATPAAVYEALIQSDLFLGLPRAI